MKKLLLFLALCSGTASAMQSGVVQPDGVTPEIKAQAEKIAGVVAKQSSKLTPEQREKSVAQAAENVQKIIDACGNDKELLKVSLSQRFVNLMGDVFVRNGCDFCGAACNIWWSSINLFIISCEIVLVLTLFYSCIYGISLTVALASGKTALLVCSPAQMYTGMLASFMHFGTHFGRSIFTHFTEFVEMGSKWITFPLLLSTFTLSCKAMANLFPHWLIRKNEGDPESAASPSAV